jgi:hypothetical protein
LPGWWRVFLFEGSEQMGNETFLGTIVVKCVIESPKDGSPAKCWHMARHSNCFGWTDPKPTEEEAVKTLIESLCTPVGYFKSKQYHEWEDQGTIHWDGAKVTRHDPVD